MFCELHGWSIESTEVKVADHLGVEAAHEVILGVEVGAEEGGRLDGLRGRRRRQAVECFGISGKVKVDGDAVDMMDGADKVFDAVTMHLEKIGEAREVEVGDGLGLEADEKGDLRRILGLESMGLVQEGTKLGLEVIQSKICLQRVSILGWPMGRRYEKNLFWVKILGAITRDMLGKAVRLEALLDRLEDDVFKRADCVFAELTRVGVMAVRH